MIVSLLIVFYFFSAELEVYHGLFVVLQVSHVKTRSCLNQIQSWLSSSV